MLKADLYSLGFYGFYLNETESMLSLIEDKEEVAERRRKKFKNHKLEELQKNLDDHAENDNSFDNGLKRTTKLEKAHNDWLKDTLSRFREDRNAKNFFRICLVFLM